MLFPTQKYAVAVCAGVRTVLLSSPKSLTSLKAAVYSALVAAYLLLVLRGIRPFLLSAAPGAGVLEARGVTVRFGGLTALDDVSLVATPRQVTGIIGPNGAGKTTLLNAVCGFVRPDSGGISFGAQELTGVRPHRLAALGIARTMQGVGLFRGLSVVENVMVGATCQARAGFLSALFGLPRSGRDERRLRELDSGAASAAGG